ncbi:MAG TPA: sensor domain-containing diguanylate cyclase [Syntrophomonadaceae bacterium]|nr:sensor domain-containing diguanylate cyclase [Syntrophomonadaceae bacterium]
MALGFILMITVNIKSLELFARIANPLLILGHIFLYIGIKQFLNTKVNRWQPITIFVVFNLFYYYFMFINNSVSGRTFIITTTIAIISFMIAYELFFKKKRYISSSANFNAIVFFVYGCFYTVRTFRVSILPSLDSYINQLDILIAGTLLSIIMSTLWTFGLIIMVNQRLNMDNQLEKEKFQSIFNTNLDAQFIMRLNDGFVIDVNDVFTQLSGYSRAEVIGTSNQEISLWHNLADRQLFIKELNDKMICENMEFIFRRKDKSQFAGMISAKITMIHAVAYIIGVIRDITESKLNELQINKLLEQLEIEKNTAQLNSLTDSMTELSNRRYFDEALKTEFFRLKRSESPLSLIMLDIDYFKNFNDSYGHLAGDQCLRMIATMLKNIIRRAPDIVARYGGEEFIVILPETDENGAKILAERIRKAVEELAIPHAASDIAKYVTASLGVVTVYPMELESPEEALKLVDEALYCAKRKGRNCCVYRTNEIAEMCLITPVNEEKL